MDKNQQMTPKEAMRILGSIGGRANFEKNGREHMRNLARKSWSTRKKGRITKNKNK